MRCISILGLLALAISAYSQFDGAGGEPGSKSVHKDHSSIIAWATSATVEKGFVQISDTSLGKPTVGVLNDVLGPMDGKVMSLGDGGSIILEFDQPIQNGAGYDFAIFENGFRVGFSYYLELGHVEVSTDGIAWKRFPSESLTDTSYQTNNFSYTEPFEVHNFAGKHQAPYGTLFDLEELEMPQVSYVKIIDVVGSVKDSFGSRDSKGRIINDPFPSPFASSGFDLDAVAVVNGTLLGREEFVLEGVQVYPSLLSVNQWINVQAPENSVVEIIDQQGRVIATSLDRKIRIEQSGIYILRVTQGSKSYHQKVCVY